MEVSGRKVNVKDENGIVADLRSGASSHMIAHKWSLTIEQAVAYSEAVSGETKTGGVAHRILLRGLLRDQASTAVRTMREVMEGTRLDVDGKLVNILLTKEDRDVASLRLRAADSVLKHASRFIDEDVIRGFIEQPNAGGMQETVFDFESEIRDDGSTVLVARPSLALVGGG